MNVQPDGESTTKKQRVTLPIHGLGCGGGEKPTIERALARVPGVEQVYVNPAIEMAYVEYDPLLTGPGQLVRAIENQGFRACRLELR